MAVGDITKGTQLSLGIVVSGGWVLEEFQRQDSCGRLGSELFG